MAKIWVLVLAGFNGELETNIAAYDSLGDCLDVAYSINNAAQSNLVYCERGLD